ASQVAGARVWMNVADRLYQLPMSLVGVAIGVALLPRLSQAFQREDRADAQEAMDQGLVFGLALSLPAAAALMAIPVYLIDALFTRGAFLSADAVATGELLFHYGWGVPAFVLQRILQPVFFARQDTKTPMRFSLISVAVNIVLGVALFFVIGIPGIAAATSVAAWITVIQMWFAIRKTGAYTPSKRAVFKLTRVAAASVAMGVALAVAAYFRGQIESVPVLGVKEIGVLVVCAAGAALYAMLLFALGGVTLAEAKAAMRRKRAGEI